MENNKIISVSDQFGRFLQTQRPNFRSSRVIVNRFPSPTVFKLISVCPIPWINLHKSRSAFTHLNTRVTPPNIRRFHNDLLSSEITANQSINTPINQPTFVHYASTDSRRYWPWDRRNQWPPGHRAMAMRTLHLRLMRRTFHVGEGWKKVRGYWEWLINQSNQ